MHPPDRLKRYLGLAMTIPFALSGCMGADGISGLDGEDGRAFTSVTWAAVPRSLSMSDPSMPSTMVKDRWYQTSPGTYQLSYTAWDGSNWAASYTIRINAGTPGEPGTPGGWFWKKGIDGADGTDGRDLYYRIGLWSTGPDMTVTSNSVAPPVIPASEIAAGLPPELQTESAATLRVPHRWTSPPTEEGAVQEREYRLGRWQITLRYWRSPGPDE